MGDSFKIYVLDDDNQDIRILKYHLDKIESMEIELSSANCWKETEESEDFKNADLIILDYLLGLEDGRDILSRIRSTGDERPIIILTGQGDEKLAVELFREGADDYLIKGELNASIIHRSLRYSINKRSSEEALRKNEERLQDFLDNANDLIQFVNPEGKLTYVNRKWSDIMGFSKEEIAEKLIYDFVHEDYKEDCLNRLKDVMAGKKIDNYDITFIKKNGEELYLNGNSTCLFENGIPVYTRCIFRDITEKKISRGGKKTD